MLSSKGDILLAQKINIGMVSLGCDKNRVDAELMLGVLRERGYNIVSDEKIADVIIVNTCGFIESASQESIDTILEIAKNKVDGRCRMLIASGCLAERYGDELLNEIPELDAAVGVGNFVQIDEVIKDFFKFGKRVKKTGNTGFDVDFNGKRILTTPRYTAYVKIAEGCNNACTYCIIPRLRGRYRSRSMEGILKEVDALSKNGTKEIILIAQDTSKYGIDIYGQNKLAELLNRVADVDGIEWVRILYCYPEDISDELIYAIKSNDNICNYIDIPIQHINNEILKKMGRKTRRQDIEAIIEKLRSNIPDIIIRTSLIVGFPGETDEQFNELYEFLTEYKLDRIGVFTYSMEEGTKAAQFEDQIDEKLKKARQRKLMLLQKRISRNKNKAKLGKTLKVLLEGTDKDGIMIGRTYGDAPDIDGIIYVKTMGYDFKVGDFADVYVTDALDYDLIGVIKNESCK